MNKVMTAAFALSALLAASGKASADVNYPWCLMEDTRGYECVFSSLVWRPVHTEPLLQTGEAYRIANGTPLAADCKGGQPVGSNMHWDKIVMLHMQCAGGSPRCYLSVGGRGGA